jgi:hypothetical protein
MASRGFTDDDMRLYGLAEQFKELSDDEQVAGRIIFLNAKGQIVDDVSLSDADVEAATNRLWAGNPANGLAVPDADIASVGDEVEAFLADGGDV